MTVTKKQVEIKLQRSLEHPVCPKTTVGNGKILLLPSDIGKRVAILFKENPWEQGRIWIACTLPPKKRQIAIADHSRHYYDLAAHQATQEVTTPDLFYMFNANALMHGHDGSTKGYLFKTESRKTLQKSIDSIKHFFFPHIYHEGYMCVRTNQQSPRSLNNLFWGSNFHADWIALYEKSRGAEFGFQHKLVTGDYNEFQKSSSPVMDERNRDYVKSYPIWFETDAKPIGVYFSCNSSVVEAVSPKSLLRWKDHYNPSPLSSVVGFAFEYRGDYLVHLKENRFLKVPKGSVNIF